MIYLREGNLYHTFLVEKQGGKTDGRGRYRQTAVPDAPPTLSAILAQAKPEERLKWEQIQHPVTHTLTQRGRPKAKEGDFLVLGGRRFYVQGVDDPGALGLWTIYYAEERKDLGGREIVDGAGT